MTDPVAVPLDDADLTFEVADFRGRVHVYVFHPHPPKAGLRIVGKLLGLAAGPFAASAGALVSVLGSGIGSLRDLIDADLSAVLAGVDFGAIGAELRTGLKAIPLDDLYGDILAHTTRDGKPIGGTAGTANFDQAFARNYVELHEAAYQVANRNGFFSLPGISGLLAKIKAAAAKAPKPTSLDQSTPP